ncbi:hypothetical protein KC336_g5762 [Hortaea werneckii]|nr:hypothetical protein KC336_g5762 [Hortaea werneckii]
MKITKTMKKSGQAKKKAMKKTQASRFASALKSDPSVFKDGQKIRFFDLASEIRNEIYTFAARDGDGGLVANRELVRPGLVSKRFRLEYMAQALQAADFVADYRLPPTLLPMPSTLPPHTILSKITNVVFQINDLNSAHVDKDKSAWQSAFFLKEVRVELSGEAASIMCSPPNAELGSEQRMQRCDVFKLIMKLDRSVVVKYDPPIDPTTYSEWEDQRERWAPDHGTIREYIKKQTRIRH